MKDGLGERGNRRLGGEWAYVGLAGLCVFVVLRWIDLSPRVETDFFFAAEDPQLQASVEIDRRFPSPPQIIIRAEGPDLEGDTYRSAVGDLTVALGEVAGVISVYSVTTSDASRSPLWRRLLRTPDGRATNLIAQTDGTDPETLIPRIEAVVERSAAPDFALEVSGVPYIIELIRRNLFRDLVVFSLAALIVFGLAVGAVYRDWRIVLGTLATCLTACAVTLSIAHLLGIAIGLLTANIVTIVFVVTLSHIVFMTSNWRRSRDGGERDAVRDAVRITLWPSFWCMTTTFLGFVSLLVASARPLRELGIAGAIGTATAIGIAYGVYPTFLRAIPSERATPAQGRVGGGVGKYLPERHGTRWLLVFVGLVALAAIGMTRLNADPGLLSYFAEGSELRQGLEAVDRDGGSSSLNIVIRDADGERIDSDEVNRKMWVLQEAIEAESAVGVVLSPAVLLADAKLAPLAGFLSWSQLLDILESPRLNRIALSFVTSDRLQGLYYLRMREAGRTEPRAEAVARMEAAVVQSGLEPVLVGGQYDLQRQLARLITSSLRIGLGGLLLLFIGIAFIVSRSARVTVAMVACLSAIPAFVLGTLGHLGLSLDIIASPAASVALAMGVDSMIHLVVRVRRLSRGDLKGWSAWSAARQQLWQPILGAMLIICGGFGIFSLSTFPPTQRFGLAVILGTVTAATMALIALPFGATFTKRR